MKPGNLIYSRCQIRRQTKDEDSIVTHVESRCAVFSCLNEERTKNYGKKIIYF